MLLLPGSIKNFVKERIFQLYNFETVYNFNLKIIDAFKHLDITIFLKSYLLVTKGRF